MKTPGFLIRPFSASLFWGIIGGMSLIAIAFYSTNGLVQVLPYPIILIAAILFLKFNDSSDKAFIRMLITGLSVFVLMSVILVAYILTFVNPHSGITLVGLLWRFGIVVAIGFISSLLLSIIAKPVRH